MTAHGSLGATPTGLISLDGTGSATLGMVPLAVPIGRGREGASATVLRHGHGAGRCSGGIIIGTIIVRRNAAWRIDLLVRLVDDGFRGLSVPFGGIKKRFVAGVMVKVAIIDVLALMGCEALLHTRKEARPIVVFSIRIGAVVGGNAFGEGECRVPNAYFVRKLFGLIVNVITVFRRSNKLGRQSLRLVRYLRDPGMGDQQQRKQDDDYENRNGKAFGKPPRQRTAKHIAKQAACPLQQRHIELLGVGGNRRIKNRADGPEDHEPSKGHMEVLILVLCLAHQTEHHKRQEYRQNHAGQSEQSGGHGM